MSQPDLQQLQSPEHRLLFLCVPGRWSDQQQAEAQRLASEITCWDQFVALAQRHRLVPQAHNALTRCAGHVPPDAVAELTTRSQQTVLHGMLMQAELVRIASSFEQAGIPLLTLKGPVVEKQVYGPGQQRQYRDLDLLIPPDRLVDGCRVLQQLGYGGQIADVEGLTPSTRRRLMKSYKHIHGERHVGPAPLIVELHWRLGGSSRVFASRMDGILDRPGSVSFGGTKVHTLPEELLLIFLAWHGGRHRWKRLSWLSDFARAVEVTPEDRWDQLLDDAAGLQLHSYLNLGLALLQEQIPDCRLPRPVQEHLSQVSGLSRALQSCRTAIVADELYFENLPLSSVQWSFQLDHSLADRLRSLKSILLPKDDDILQRGWWPANLQRMQHLCRRSVGLLTRHRSDTPVPTRTADTTASVTSGCERAVPAG